MKYIFPTVMLSGGIYFLASGQGIIGMFLCFFGAVCFSDLVEKDNNE